MDSIVDHVLEMVRIVANTKNDLKKKCYLILLDRPCIRSEPKDKA